MMCTMTDPKGKYKKRIYKNTKIQNTVPTDSQIPSYLDHIPEGTSTRPFVHFAQLHNRVKVAGHEDVYLRVEGGEEPPDHGEHVGGVGKEGMRQLVDRAEVEAVVGTGKTA